MSRIRRLNPRAVLAGVVLAVVGLTFAGCGGGGSSGATEPGVGGPFRVVQVSAFPNGSLLPVTPQPSTENQYLMIEFSKGVDPASLFDPTTTNGLASALRLINHYYVGLQNPPTSPPAKHTGQRLEGFLVWNGQTNLDLEKGVFRPANQLTPVTPKALRVSDANWRVQTNICYFIADTDQNPATVESFLPAALKSASFQASQIQVDCQTTIKAYTHGERLADRYAASFNVGTRDYIYPIVDTVEPVRDQQNVNVNAQIKIRFIEPIEASTIMPAPPQGPTPQTNLLVEALVPGPQGPQAVQVNGTVSPTSGATVEAVFTPQSGFPGNTLIKVTITPGAGNYLDLSNNELNSSSLTGGSYTFTTGPGPALANNPVPPQVVHLITQNSELAAIETNEYDDQRSLYEDFYVPVNDKGAVRFPILGGLMDMQIGPFIAPFMQVPGSTWNVIHNPPFQQAYLPIIAGNPPRPPGAPLYPLNVYSPPGTQPDLTICPPPYGPQVQPIGNFLFVSNEEKDRVHVINSNTYQIFKDFITPDPRGLAIDPLMQLLFVTNFGSNSVSVLDLSPDPKTLLPRGKLIRNIRVGQGPDAIAFNPNAEDVFVVNRLDNSVSVIQLSQINGPNPVRLTVTGNIGPDCRDVACTGRIPPLPPWFPYLPPYAYFANLGANNISVFESGPLQINGYGRDNIIQVIEGFPQPTSVNSDETSGATAQSHDPIPPKTSLTGCWVTCAGDNTVKWLRAKRFRYINFPNPPPQYIGVDYEVSLNIKVGERPQDVVVRDPFSPCLLPPNNNKGAPDLPASGIARAAARLYVANGDGSVSVIDLNLGREKFRLPGIGVRKMCAYYTQ